MRTNEQCQSCGMPIHSEELAGTAANGSLVYDYCKYCYQNGGFAQPNITMEDMIRLSIPFLLQEGWEEEAARNMLHKSLPLLKRWADQEKETPVSPSIQPLEFVEKEAFTLSGKAVRTTNAAEMSGQGLIPGLWASFFQESTEVRPSDPIYGCYTDYENAVFGQYTFLLGSAVSQGEEIADELNSVTLPAARYAVFRTEYGPLYQVVAEAWQHIWQWSASVQGLERTFSGDFELYNEFAGDAGSGQADIYIAVRESTVRQC
ncbi:effector binding domain-containing protein [Paenibacillus jiagnxiensis]|uniref:effector binding domain-containing protein n=1 Tax=Paenibacillus jiagnxiensis TaxID=3228926 RepID=UPI0033BA94A9